MSDQPKANPAKFQADAAAAALGAQSAAPALAAAEDDASKVKPAKDAPAAKVTPAQAPKAATATPAPSAKPAVAAKTPKAVEAKVEAQAKPAPLAAAKPKPAPLAAKPKTTKIKSAVSKSPVAAKAPVFTQKKESIMTTAETMTAETKKAADAMTDRVKSLMGDVSARAKTAYEKGTEMVSQASEFNKGNVEALVESSKIAAKGAQEMTQAYAEETKKGFEELTAAFKEFTSVKSPTEFIELQSKLVRKSFDTAVAQTSKNSEAFLKLAGDVIQPISNRVSVAVDSFKKAA